MDEDKLNQRDVPDFVPGIYNYCDRWCERCEKRLQCISYVMGKKMEEKTRLEREGQLKREGKSLWSRLKNMFGLTNEVLQELAKERSISVEDIYASEQLDQQFLGGNLGYIEKDDALYVQIEACDILKVCKIYEYWGERCIDRFSEWMEQEEYEHAEEIEIVTWYLDLIQTKMRKALHAKALLEMGEEEGQRDYEGSVKVGLIAIDKSIVAWKKIHVFYPNYRKEIEHLLVILQQIQIDIEREFPTARQFIRPGFDTE